MLPDLSCSHERSEQHIEFADNEQQKLLRLNPD